MPRILRRPAAEDDLAAQWVWYAENGGTEVADRFLSAVQATLSALARRPASGTLLTTGVRELQGIRRFRVGGGFERILLFYIPVPNGIDLIRVIHGSRDWEHILID